MGFVITGYANLMILGEIPSYPVAFLIFNLFIYLFWKYLFLLFLSSISRVVHSNGTSMAWVLQCVWRVTDIYLRI